MNNENDDNEFSILERPEEQDEEEENWEFKQKPQFSYN